jgi:hypothetical protein
LENAFPSGSLLPPEENVHYSILADPLVNGSLNNAYALIEHPPFPSLALALNIRERLTPDNLPFVASFLFLPSYLSIEYRRVVILTGDRPELLMETAQTLSGYLSSQGIPDPLIHIILPAGPEPMLAGIGQSTANNYPSFHSVEMLAGYYRHLLQTDRYYDNNIFFHAAEEEVLRSAILSLQQAEIDFAQNSSKLYSLIHTNRLLEKELSYLRRKQASTETELNNHKQYVEVLRSDHAAKELQDYYTHEYEILPLWYKRFGHILKVLTGKRTFQSLFRDDVKKYKD